MLSTCHHLPMITHEVHKRRTRQVAAVIEVRLSTGISIMSKRNYPPLTIHLMISVASSTIASLRFPWVRRDFYDRK